MTWGKHEAASPLFVTRHGGTDRYSRSPAGGAFGLTPPLFGGLPTIVRRAVLEELGIIAVWACGVDRIGLPEDPAPVDLSLKPTTVVETAMSTPYNRIAGHNLERLAALSDGIFAVAMTLLVLDLHLPLKELVHNNGQLWHALAGMSSQIISYLMSFITLGIFWNGQQAQLDSFSRSNRHLSWIHIVFLFAVSVMPFSTRLLAEFISFRSALLCYWGNVLLLGVILYASWKYAKRAGLLKEDVTKAFECAVERRIVVAQALYAIGALLCLINNYLSIGFIILVQLNFALAPQIPYLAEI